MPIPKMLRAAMLAPVLLALPAYSVPADPDTLIDPAVTPIERNGQPAACTLSFDLQRKSGSDRVSLSITYYRISATATARALKIGYIAPGKPAEAPETIFFIAPGGDNRAESLGSQFSETPGYTLAAFNGTQTNKAFDAIATTGKINIGLVFADGRGQSWSADLGPRKDLRDAWAKCVREAVPAK